MLQAGSLTQYAGTSLGMHPHLGPGTTAAASAAQAGTAPPEPENRVSKGTWTNDPPGPPDRRKLSHRMRLTRPPARLENGAALRHPDLRASQAA